MTRILAFSFCFIIFWKILTSRARKREEGMQDYMKMQQEMEVLNRMHQNPEMYYAIQREVMRRDQPRSGPQNYPPNYPPPPGHNVQNPSILDSNYYGRYR